jgi:hypothetical protein
VFESASAEQTRRNSAACEPAIVKLHTLSSLDEGDEVTVGRPDVGEYVVLPADGAALLRRLDEGASLDEAAAWYQATYQEPIDIEGFVDDLDQLGFVRHGTEEKVLAAPVRWHRLGSAVFSPAVGTCYGVLILAWIAATIRDPILLPRVQHLFFTPYLSVVAVALFLAQTPLILLHEAAHALAGRRLGLHSRLGIGRRLYFVVFETTLNGLVSVPRPKRYLPILAGLLTDLGVLAALTLLAAALRHPDGSFPPAAQLALALAYLTLLRVAWQFFFYLRTDIYYLIVTVLGCLDLQTTSTQLLRNRLDRRLGRPETYDSSTWHPVDHAVARWYASLIVVGYTVSVAVGLTGVPGIVHMIRVVAGRFSGNGAQGTAGLVDSIVMLVLVSCEPVLAAVLAARERARRRQPRASAATASRPETRLG